MVAIPGHYQLLDKVLKLLKSFNDPGDAYSWLRDILVRQRLARLAVLEFFMVNSLFGAVVVVVVTFHAILVG